VKEDAWAGTASRLFGDDFDLRDEVMFLYREIDWVATTTT